LTPPCRLPQEHSGNDPSTQLVPPATAGGWNKDRPDESAPTAALSAGAQPPSLAPARRRRRRHAGSCSRRLAAVARATQRCSLLAHSLFVANKKIHAVCD
jgi:hypothetical protein